MSGLFRTFPLKDLNPVSGKVKYRSINDPDNGMREIHKLIIAYVSGLGFPLPFATACRKGDSPRKNVERHRRNTHFYLTDLHDAYGNVRGDRLADLLAAQESGASDLRDRILSFLQRFCLSERGGLIVGAPASPILFNLYAGEYLDKPLGQMCQRWGLVYTRYLDDLTFSSSEDCPIGKKKRKTIRDCLTQVGFDVSHRKSQVCDLRKGAITINGVGLEYGGRIFCPRHYVRKIQGAMHFRFGKKNPDSKTLAGMMGVFKNLTTGRPNRTEAKLMSLAANRGIPRPKPYTPPPRRKEWWEKF